MTVVKKSSYDQALQSYWWTGRILSKLIARPWGARMFQRLFNGLKGRPLKGFQSEEHTIPSTSGGQHTIRVRIFRPAEAKGPLPAMLYLHGGGYMVGAPEQAFPFYEAILKKRPIAIIAPAYRLSLKDPYPAGLDDCYDTLLWMKQEAEALNILNDNFIVAGHSAGGGLTAALTLKARDRQAVNIAFQMPYYPMLDHRESTASSKMVKTPVWDAQNNAFAWKQYLKGLGEGSVPAYASPALNKDYSNFPPTISYVGELEPFHDEVVAYMEALEKANVPTLFKVYPKAFHAFETIAPKTPLGEAANQFQIEAFATYFDQYIKPSHHD